MSRGHGQIQKKIIAALQSWHYRPAVEGFELQALRYGVSTPELACSVYRVAAVSESQLRSVRRAVTKLADEGTAHDDGPRVVRTNGMWSWPTWRWMNAADLERFAELQAVERVQAKVAMQMLRK